MGTINGTHSSNIITVHLKFSDTNWILGTFMVILKSIQYKRYEINKFVFKKYYNFE